MLNNQCPAIQDIGTAETARAVFWQGNRFVNAPLVSLREKLIPGRVPLAEYGVPSDGTDATAAFEAALTSAAADGVIYLQATEGGIYALQGAEFPAASFDIDWNGATIQATYTAGGTGTHNVLTANVQQNVGGTSIGDLTGGGGLAAAFDGDNSKTYAQSATVAATTGYIGKTPASAVKVSRAVFYCSSDKGAVSGATETVTFSLRANTGAAPSDPENDGTLLGSITFTDCPSFLTYTDEVGDFSAAETITGDTSGATATLSSIIQVSDDPPDELEGTGVLYYGEVTTGPFIAGETITGGTSGATAVVGEVVTPRRVIVSKDKTSEWDNVWLVKSSATASTAIAMVEFHEAAEHTLAFRNVIVDGGWPGSGSSPTASEDVMLAKGYQKFELSNAKFIGCNRGGSATVVLHNRENAIVSAYNNDLSIVDGYVADGNRSYEGLVFTSDDATHVASVERSMFLNQLTSGSNLNALNMGGFSWRDSVVSGANAGPNILARYFHVDNVHLSDITDKGIDTTEALYHCISGIVENCSFTNIDDEALSLGGVSLARNNYFENCGVGIDGETELASRAKESATGCGNAAFGEWLGQVEAPIRITCEGNTFNGTANSANPNIRIFGTATHPATVSVNGADRAATGNTQPNSSVLLRYVKSAHLTGTFYDGSEALFDIDGGAGAVITYDGDFHPQSGAHLTVLDRASSTLTTPTATIHWTARAKRHGTLDASHYDFSLDGANPGTYTAFYFEGPNWPTLDTAVAVTVPVVKNGKWWVDITSDANKTLVMGPYEIIVNWDVALAAERTITFTNTDAVAGVSRAWITRTAGGAFNLQVGTAGALDTLTAAGEGCLIGYNGSANYREHL